MSEQLIELDARGQPPVKRVKRSTQQLQRRLRSFCEDRRDGRKSVAETLRGLGHCIRFVHYSSVGPKCGRLTHRLLILEI